MAKTTAHKEGKATVKVVYYTSKAMADGSHPFMVRLTKDRKLKYIATGLTLHPKFWNPQKKEIRKSYPEPYREDLLSSLQQWEKKYSLAAHSLSGADQQHDVTAVADKAIEGRQTRRVTLLAYMDELVGAMVAAKQKGNSIIYRDLRNQLADFIRHQSGKSVDLSFSEVSVRFCNQLETFFRERGNTDTTLSNRFRTLRAVINKAIAEGLAQPDQYPFARNVSEKHKFSIGKFDTSTQKRAITREDIRKVEGFVPSGSASGKSANLRNAVEVDRLTLAKNIFLFSFFGAGINFVDIAKLRWRDIGTDETGAYRLNYVRQKTGGKFSVRLLPSAAAIIDRYKLLTGNSADEYIFPILNRSQHQTPIQVHNRIHKVSAMVNADLKLIGERVGIDTPLTTYVARHSFATSLRRSGVADAVTGQALGHKNASVTAIYLDSFASETIDSAMNALL